ncbi:hypothetical protein AAHA92_18772 [Salvia divinorum]|uniref:F-box domain-containing protein n=1 Tax=Salvia divinorum TaxID=28513 RepID=A0ABD1H361_SALDI
MDKKQKAKADTQIPHIPEEIMEEILSMLPVKSLMKFQTVCKSWSNLISKSHFSKLHLQRSIDANRTSFVYLSGCDTNLAYEASTGKLVESESVAVSILAYCNGLLCIGLGDDLLLWNPSTKKAREIPTSPVEFPTPASTMASAFFGLGHRSASDDYKLVRISIFNDMDFQTEVKIYSTNTNTWRRVGDFPYDYPLGRTGVFASGCLHWIVSVWEGGAHHHRIAMLDLADDSYGWIHMPDMGHKVPVFFDIGTLDGKLVVFRPPTNADGSSSIWILEDHNKEESWTTIRIAIDGVNRLEAFVFLQPLWFMKPGRILVRLGAKLVASFDVTGKRRCDMYIPHMLEWRMLNFVESLVSPNLT